MTRRAALALAGVAILIVGLVLLTHFVIQRQLTNEGAPSPLPSPTATTSIAPTPDVTATAAPSAIPEPTPEPTALPTVTPIPSPTRIPASPTNTPPPPTPTFTPGPIVTNDKLGVGVYSSGTLVGLRVLRPAMLLIMDPDPRTAQEYRSVFPKSLIVGRRFVQDHDPKLANCDNPSEDHMAKGTAFADFVAQSAVPLKGVVDAWVSDNEQASGSDPTKLACHAQFQTGFVEQLQGKYGIDAVAGNDASGAVEPADYPKYFAKPISEAKYFGIHAYGKPEATTLKTPDAQYYALRYRMIHDELLKAKVPLPQKGFLLTETGLFQGWRGLVPDPVMADSFIWLEGETEKDDYLKGQFIFGIGQQPDKFGIFELLGTTLNQLLGEFNAQHAGTYP